MKRFAYIFILMLGLTALAMPPQDDTTRQGGSQQRGGSARRAGGAAGAARGGAARQDGGAPADSSKVKRPAPKAQPKALTVVDETIPDSLLNARWRIQPTAPVLIHDLDSSALDLHMPENIKQEAVYDDSLGVYYLGSKMGEGYLNAPIVMSPEEYMKWSERRARYQFFRQKDAENVKTKGENKFDFSDMQFDLGPAEKIFGPGGVRVKTQGNAELKVGATLKNIDNPSLPIRNRKTTSFDFDEKINLSVNGKVGDKVNMNLNYNTDATFDFDTKNLKLKYDGKEDEMIKLVEAGNVTFPSNNSLVHGASSLFGIRTDWQFGKLKLQTVISQKKSTSKSVSSHDGAQTTAFELNAADYEENRHFFLSHFFRQIYDRAMSTLPNVTTGIQINRIEVWVTNKTNSTSNTRNIVAFSDLGENQKVKNPFWKTTGMNVPSNLANTEYSSLVAHIDTASRSMESVTAKLETYDKLAGGVDYEKLSAARLLNSSEYTVNNALGYISLKTGLQTDQVLAVAFEYTYGGQTYQVGEFSTDVTQANRCLFVKALKNTSNNPQQGNWDLMMKNVYYLATSVEKEKFRLDIKYQSDTTGTYLTYLPVEALKQTTLLKVMNLDRLDANNKNHSNGQFDFVNGYTVSNGRIFLPSAEPFGDYLRNYLEGKGMGHLADVYCFDQLYDSTKTVAKQNAEKNKYIMTGQFKGRSGSVYSLGAYNVPRGSVKVVAGGVELQEGSDYSVDYSAGEVTILNQSILDSQQGVTVSYEDNTNYGMQRKTMLGVNWEYDFTKNFTLGGTFMHLSEQALTTKVNMGEEPLNNTIWGLNLNWKQQSQWLTNVLDKLPLLHCTQPSSISLTGEFAHLIAGKASGTQDNASYLDDFESAKDLYDVSDPKAWVLSSVPPMFPNSSDKTSVSSGYDRALLAWYTVDPIFTRRSSSLTPSHIKSDLEQLSNHYVREVYVRELFPNRDQSSYSGVTSTLPVLNLAYYPKERGPYNLTTQFNPDGTLMNPAQKWGGMMRRLETTDFEQANIEYVEFWMLDPFIYTRKDGTASRHSGELYINLGEVSEDVLRDGKKFDESAMPVDGTSRFDESPWGRIPIKPQQQEYAFANTDGARQQQDVGLNGLTDEDERTFGAYAEWLNAVGSIVQNDSLLAAWRQDPAGDDYHYYRGSDFDAEQKSIMDRYKRINNPQGNSPSSENQSESYDSSYKTGPDVEDLNQDYTLNEYERYYQYRIPISDDELQAYNRGQKSESSYIVDHRDYTAKLRNGDSITVRWYQYRIPLTAYQKREGSINDFTSIRFMRMFLTGFEEDIVLRFGSLDLVRGTWRQYKQNLQTSAGAETGTLEMSAVNVEENTERQPVAYVLPPGISRVTDPNQPQLTENNEQALCLVVKNLSQNESKAVYKNINIDLRQYKRLQMFVHANNLVPNSTQLEDNQLAVFIRLGSDYKNNYYEYLIPLRLTPEGHYRWNVPSDRPKVWPEDNMLDIDLDIFTQLKKQRNIARAEGTASYNQVFSDYDPAKPNNKISIVGNPSIGDVKTMIIGVRNLSNTLKSGEVWVNELRLKDAVTEGGWAASGALNVQLSDVGRLDVSGRYLSDGFGGLEEGVMQRRTDTEKSYSITANVELGKFFPDKAKVSAPLYYSYTKQITSPKYNPLDTDMRLDDALESAADQRERDSIESIAVTKRITSNFSLSNIRVDIKNKKHPLPIDPANFSFTYSHSHSHNSGETTVYENRDEWKGSLNYSYSPVYKTWEPFNKTQKNQNAPKGQNAQRGQKSQSSKGGNSKWSQFPKAIGINYLPQNISFNSEWHRSYYELQSRDLENTEDPNLPLTFSEQFLWNREFSLRWDFTKNLHMNFQSATHAEIEEPYTPVNKDLYPDRYTAWKDSVWTSLKHWGTPLDYRQSFTASYQVPLDKLPIFDWLKADATYSSSYSWMRGTELEDGTSLGNTISNNRNLNINGALNLETLYNHIPFLKKTNERFKKQQTAKNTKDDKKKKQEKKAKEQAQAKAAADGKGAPDDKAAQKEKAELPKNKNTFQKEITLRPDTVLEVQHGKKSKRLLISAKNKDGKAVQLKWKVVDENKIKVWLPKETAKAKAPKKRRTAPADSLATDSLLAANATADSLAADSLAPAKNMAKGEKISGKKAKTKAKDKALAKQPATAAEGEIALKLSITPKEPLENKWWYNPAQQVARFLMMLRNVNVTYRNQRSMTLPGFMPGIGDMFGQRTGSVLAPGLDFAFGFTGDGYINKAMDNGWLLSSANSDNTSTVTTTSASSTATEDLQVKATLEPVRDLKIDLTATRTSNQSRTVQFVYQGMPTTYGGTFTMTTISLRSALEGMGDANNGYHSDSFDRFCASVNAYRDRVQAQYPTQTEGRFAGANQVDPYSADVLVPAFLNTYTLGAGGSLDIFPAITRLLPNWSFRYAGLAKLPWFRDHFKSFNLNHAYKSIYSVGSYASYSSWVEYMGDRGYVQAADGTLSPSSRFNVSTVSINEAFSPLLGIDMTFNNNLTAKVEYKTTRVLTLSMTSVQINEALSKDWVIGLGYKITNFNLFGSGSSRKVKGSKKGSDDSQSSQSSQKAKKSGVNHDLNTRLDISFRKQASITRDIATGLSSASSGNSALKISLAADYTLSRFLTLTAYYDRQTNTPLLSASSYPTTTQDFGISVKFSLTR
ncbi:MAG: cell surface protein SprA [Prevotella sp.]|nr:cell surface protein SprA [Prevotella sp.]